MTPTRRTLRRRHSILLGGSVAVLITLLATDPSQGVTTGLLVMSTAVGLLCVVGGGLRGRFASGQLHAGDLLQGLF